MGRRKTTEEQKESKRKEWRLKRRGHLKEYDRNKNQSVDGKKYGRIQNWKRYGIKITHEEYMKKFDNQNGSCAICKIKQEDLKMALAVDHNHETGQIRGLLCSSCNLAIGNLKDSHENAFSAFKYLINNETQELTERIATLVSREENEDDKNS